MNRLPVPGGLAEATGAAGPASLSVESPAGHDGALSATEAALADLQRALCQDRAHVVLSAAPGPEEALLLRTLPERLAGCLGVIDVRAPAAPEDEIYLRILGGLGLEPGPEPEARLQQHVQELAGRGSGLALLVRDAGSAAPAMLRRLGQLAASTRPGLRLVLVVTTRDRPEGDPVADVVAALGLGAEKVVLGTPRDAAARRLEPPAAVPPRPEAPEPRTGHAAAPLPQPRSAGLRLGRGAAHAAAILGIGVPPPPPPTGLAGETPTPVATEAAIAAPVPAPIPSAPAREAPPPPAAATPPTPEVKVAAPEGAPRATGTDGSGEPETTAARGEGPGPAIASRVRPIRVNLNARPWARIEVDGKDVGVTPLADVPIDPGVHRFRARLPDGRVIERSVRIDAYRDHVTFP
jgi:hypothetical protein